ncbi:MAG: peptidylprolyl isomerase [Prosthecobacter sp.]
MKIPSLLRFSLLTLASAVSLQAQDLKAPDSLRPSPVAPVPAAPASDSSVEKLAEEAQKSLYDAVGGGGEKTASAPVSRAPVIPLESPSRWERDSVRKLAVMDIAFGGSRETVMIELFPDAAPQTVSNFIDRCDSGFYNGLAFHRAIEGFLVQTGDPLTSDESAREKWGTGGEDKTIPAEIKRHHRLGAVAMARRSDKVNPSRRSNGSQFYICLGNYGSIDMKYTVFGQVVSGLEVVQNIARMPVDSNDCPVARIEVKSIKIVDHKGPLQVQEVAGQRYSKPDSSRGFVGRMLHRFW